MSHFPEPVSVPEEVFRERGQRLRALSKSALWGIALRTAIILFELLGVYLYGSVALLYDALASLFDVFSSVALLAFIRLAEKPPDKNHPFGHGRYEPLVGMQLGLFLAVTGGFLVIRQTFQLLQEGEPHALSGNSWIFSLVALVLLEVCYRVVMFSAKRHHSPAMAADAYHYRVDAATSLFATVALLLAAYFPSWSLTFDHIGAIVIAGLMVVLGCLSAWANFHQLMDRVPEESFFEKVRMAARRVKGVMDTEKIRIQLYGPDAHVDIDVEVDPALSVEVAHGISQKVRVEIQKEWPAVRDVTVHLEPYYPGDHQPC